MPPEDFNNERARISKQRDDIMDIMTEKFKEHISNEDMKSAMALADEYFEWLHPDIAMHEDTLYSHETELQRTYLELTSGWEYERTCLSVHQSKECGQWR